MTSTRVLSATLVLLSIAWPQQDSTPDQNDLVRKIRETYATCDSYRDRGEVRTVFVDADKGRRTILKPFETAFLRPDGFRFEYRDRRGEEEWDRYVIWTDEAGTHSWWTIQPETRDWNDLANAIAAATGVSAASSYRVPSLLMPDLIRGRPALRDEAKLMGEEMIEGTECYKIEDPEGDTLWFEKDTLLLRKVVSAVKELPGEVSVETTTTYTPEANVELGEEDLGFEPRAK